MNWAIELTSQVLLEPRQGSNRAQILPPRRARDRDDDAFEPAPISGDAYLFPGRYFSGQGLSLFSANQVLKAATSGCFWTASAFKVAIVAARPASASLGFSSATTDLSVSTRFWK